MAAVSLWESGAAVYPELESVDWMDYPDGSKVFRYITLTCGFLGIPRMYCSTAAAVPSDTLQGDWATISEVKKDVARASMLNIVSADRTNWRRRLSAAYMDVKRWLTSSCYRRRPEK